MLDRQNNYIDVQASCCKLLSLCLSVP